MLRISKYKHSVNLWSEMVKRKDWKEIFKEYYRRGYLDSCQSILHAVLLSRNPRLDIGTWSYVLRDLKSIGLSGVAVYFKSIR